jgi:type II secretory pathway component PulM
MAGWMRRLAHQVDPRSGFSARGAGRPPRASSIILGMTTVLLLVVLLAKALTQLFTAI